MRITSETLYLTDGGACYCGDHLGTTARYTGRDISGQPIHAVTPDDAHEAESLGVTLTCDEPRCGRTPSRLYTV